MGSDAHMLSAGLGAGMGTTITGAAGKRAMLRNHQGDVDSFFEDSTYPRVLFAVDNSQKLLDGGCKVPHPHGVKEIPLLLRERKEGLHVLVSSFEQIERRYGAHEMNVTDLTASTAAVVGAEQARMFGVVHIRTGTFHAQIAAALIERAFAYLMFLTFAVDHIALAASSIGSSKRADDHLEMPVGAIQYSGKKIIFFLTTNVIIFFNVKDLSRANPMDTFPPPWLATHYK